MTKRWFVRVSKFAAVSAVAVLAVSAHPAGAIDWNGVEGKTLTLFYPGQSSWEWVLTQSDHSGAKKIRGGKPCYECHAGEEKKIGDLIVSGKKLEPAPIAGKAGTLDVNVKVANDGERLYFRLEWSDPAAPAGQKMEAKSEAIATIMLEDGHTIESKLAGCWGACHADLKGMPKAVEGHDLTKYLAKSRTKITRDGGGENYKSDADLAALLSEGDFFEYWSAHLDKGAAAKAVDGYALDKRHFDQPPEVAAVAEFKDGMWVVELSRKLKVGKPGFKDVAAGGSYIVAFAVHTNHADGRHHYVSFHHTLALDGGQADFVAARK